jgi:glycosyltransferase involved in cell wall biosynthesis
VVDDRSTDGTPELLARLGTEDERVRSVRIEETPEGWAGKMYALQRGVEASRGEIILTTDADCIAPSRWISLLAGRLRADGPFSFVASPVDYRGAAAWHWPRRLLRTEFVSLSLVSAGSTGAGFPLVASGQSLGYSRALFDRIGGYAHCARYRTGDDIFMLFEARRVGARVSYVLDSHATVVTTPPRSIRAFYHQRARWASKGFRFPPGALIFSSLVWLLNAGLLAGAVAAILGWGWLLPWLFGAAAVKASGEVAFLLEGRVLGLRGVVLDYLTGLLLHIPYVAVAGTAGTLQLFRWK